MSDMLEIANEVQDTLGRSYGMPEDIDEADLEAGLLLFAISVYYYFGDINITMCYSTNCVN